MNFNEPTDTTGRLTPEQARAEQARLGEMRRRATRHVHKRARDEHDATRLLGALGLADLEAAT